MIKSKSVWSFLVLMIFFLSACKKDNFSPSQNSENNPTNSTQTNGNINAVVKARAIAAAAKNDSNAKNWNNPTDSLNTCGCYTIFDGINFDASPEEIEAAIETVLEQLSEEELTRLFEPVCTQEGKLYESACVADCNGITNYRECTEEELDDYFFDDFDCDFEGELTFPFELELPDGTLVTVNSEEELWALIDQWYEEHEGDYEEEEDCFELVYPVTVQYPDGNTIMANTEDELEQIFEDWEDQNGEDSETYPTLVYPFQVLDADSMTINVENMEQEVALWEQCYGDEFEICFDVVFPVTVNLPDGTTTTADSEDALEDIYNAWLEQHGDDTENCPEIAFPFDITLEDGITQTITNEEELDRVLENCYDDIDHEIRANPTGSTLVKRIGQSVLQKGTKKN